ncbi:MAG: hypothetical protein J5850_03245 [Clostridia bacterium]|nr:hypothetical protein [Clostridia bacterium]
MRKRKIGDRRDGYRLRGLDPYDTVSPYIMVERNVSSNFFRDSIEMTNAEKFIKAQKEKGLTNFGLLHIFLAAYVRTVSQKPYLNRFISGQKVFARNNIEINMAVKPKFDRESTDTVIKVHFDPSDTAKDVYNKFQSVYESAVSAAETSFDSTAKIINYIPGLVKKFVVWLLKLLDYFGLLPNAILKVSPFHGSMFITSMGSLGIPPIYHHLYDFGNCPVFIAFGAPRHEYEITESGEVKRKKYVDFTVVTDERICDGFSYASGLKAFRRLFTNPWILDKAPEKIVEDSNIDAKTSPKKLRKLEQKAAKKAAEQS